MSTLVIPIQPDLPNLLHASKDATTWVLTVTLLAAAVATPISGRLGDLYGKRRVALALLAAMAVGSLICALSGELGPLIVGRALQGVALGVISLGISTLRDVLHPDRLGAAIALVSATLGVGGAVGLPVSALIVQYLDWHAIFWLSAALAVVIWGLVALFVPASTAITPGSFDVVGAVGIACGLSAILLAVSEGNAWGWTSPAVLGTGMGGVVVLVLWGIFELRSTSPLVDLRVATRATVLRTNLASIAMGFALFTSSVAYPQLLELPLASGVGLGLGILSTSLVMMPSGISMMAMSPIAARLIARTGPRAVLALGGLLLAVSYLLAFFFMAHVWQILIASVIGGMGAGLGYASMPTLIMRAVPNTETAAANGLNAVMRTLGTTIAAAIFGSLLAKIAIEIGSVSVPTASAFRIVFGIATFAAIVSALVAFSIPSDPLTFEPTNQNRPNN